MRIINLTNFLSTIDVSSLLTPTPLLVERRGRRVGMLGGISDALLRCHPLWRKGARRELFSGKSLLVAGPERSSGGDRQCFSIRPGCWAARRLERNRDFPINLPASTGSKISKINTHIPSRSPLPSTGREAGVRGEKTSVLEKTLSFLGVHERTASPAKPDLILKLP